MTRAPQLPHWRLDQYFPGLESPQFRQSFDRVLAGTRELRALFDELGVRRDGGGDAAAYDRATGALNTLMAELRLVSSYIFSFAATDSRDPLPQALQSELEAGTVELPKLETRYEAWLGTMDVEALLSRSATAREHEHSLRRAATTAAHLMPEAEEDLAAELWLPGAAAWGKLHRAVSSQLSVTVDLPGGARTMPMSEVRGLAWSPDPATRRSAYDAELVAWEGAAVPLAAALNGVKGMAGTLDQRRRWADSLEPALHANAVDAETLAAMQAACTEAFPDLRRYLRAKARILGAGRLAWWDMFAPLPGSGDLAFDFEGARRVVEERFATFSPRLAALAARAFGEGWIDAEPRPGKTDGAFCMSTAGGESRVLVNFEGSIKSVQTLAHELGHAYHNLNLEARTGLQRRTPMTLAETASNFCQTIVTNSLLGSATGGQRLAILEDGLEHATQVVVDIHSRFLFEKAVFDARRRRELTVPELKEMMLDAQRQTYGDGLDPQALHPFMWAVKGHYYGRSFYNFPYTFGLLFGLGLYRRYESEGEGFVAGYEELLSSTGMADAAALAGRFGIDTRSIEFWRSSLDVIRDRVEQYESIAGGAGPA